jgi:hypothetical protein
VVETTHPTEGEQTVKISKAIVEKAKIASVKHWEELRDNPRSSTPSARDCPLCTLFIKSENNREPCEGCPVALKTGLPGCEGSPWRKAFKQWCRFYDGKKNTFKQAAQAEIDFLKSLI